MNEYCCGNIVKISSYDDLENLKGRPHSVGDYGEVVGCAEGTEMHQVRTAHGSMHWYRAKDLMLYASTPVDLILIGGRSLPANIGKLGKGYSPVEPYKITNSRDLQNAYVRVSSEFEFHKTIAFFKERGYGAGTVHYHEGIERVWTVKDDMIQFGNKASMSIFKRDVTGECRKWGRSEAAVRNDTKFTMLIDSDKPRGNAIDAFKFGVSAHDLKDSTLAKHLETFLNFKTKKDMGGSLEQLKFDNFIKANQTKIIDASEKLDDFLVDIKEVNTIGERTARYFGRISEQLHRAFDGRSKDELNTSFDQTKAALKLLGSKEFLELVEASKKFDAVLKANQS